MSHAERGQLVRTLKKKKADRNSSDRTIQMSGGHTVWRQNEKEQKAKERRGDKVIEGRELYIVVVLVSDCEA